MKHRLFTAAFALLVCAGAVVAQAPQEKAASRVATREKLRQLLVASGPKKGIGIDSHQSDKQPFNFTASSATGWSTRTTSRSSSE